MFSCLALLDSMLMSLSDIEDADWRGNKGTPAKVVKNRMLIPGFVSEEVFDLLIELSSVHSIKIVNAMHDYLVFGENKKDVCDRYGANASYFSIALGRLFRVNQIVSQLISYYH